MMDENRQVIKIRYCIIKGIVGYLMHISADSRLVKRDRMIVRIVFFAVLTVFFAVGSTQFDENTVKIMSLVLAGISLILSGVFLIIYAKNKGKYLHAEDQIITAEITEEGIVADVNGRSRTMPLDGTLSFTQNSEYYVIMDGEGGFFLPFAELDPNEKYLCDLWFSRGMKYVEPKLRGGERAPKMKF